jgi:hypothetical protein
MAENKTIKRAIPNKISFAIACPLVGLTVTMRYCDYTPFPS